MATTGEPNLKYVASDEPDLVNGAYAEHVHSVPINELINGARYVVLTDYDNELHSYDSFSTGSFTPTKVLATDGNIYGNIPVDKIAPAYTKNLSNVTPIGVQTSALDSPKGIVSHDLHVVLTHYPPMAGDASETEIVVPRLVGHIEVDGTLGGGGGAVSPNARYLQITFDNFPTDATNYGSSNVAVVTSGSNPTYLGTCFVPMTLGSTLSNAVIVSLPTVGDSGTLDSPTIYFS